MLDNLKGGVTTQIHRISIMDNMTGKDTRVLLMTRKEKRKKKTLMH